MLWILLWMTGCEAEECTVYDPGGGLYRCDQVLYCEVGDGPRWYYKSAVGELYDCQAQDTECTRMMCDACILGADVRELVCDG